MGKKNRKSRSRVKLILDLNFDDTFRGRSSRASTARGGSGGGCFNRAMAIMNGDSVRSVLDATNERVERNRVRRAVLLAVTAFARTRAGERWAMSRAAGDGAPPARF